MSAEKYGLDFCYLGNPNLRRSGTKIEVSEEEKEEYIRCFNDPIYFLENYCKIVSLDEGLVNFKPYDYQKEMIRTMHRNRFTIILAARQMGKSVTSAGYLLWSGIFAKNQTIAILANKQEQAMDTLERLQIMYENLPWFLQPGVKTWNKKSIRLGNGTKIFISATGGSAVRGRSLTHIYLDEFAFVDNAEKFYTSVYPVISSGKDTKVIVSSTPNGMNMFYRMWQDAVDGRSEFKPFKATWDVHPKRDEKWKATQIANLEAASPGGGARQFRQEFECVFEGSSDTLISSDCLQKLRYKQPLSQDHNSRIFEKPKKGAMYVITVDVGEGVEKDSSVISVFDVSKTPYRHVAVWQNNTTTPIKLAPVVVSMAKLYNEAFVIIENNSVGHTVANSVWYDYDYDNVLRTLNDKDNTEVRSAGDTIIGLRMTSKVKLRACSALKDLIESGILEIYDKATIEELQCFAKSGSTWKAEKGKHDDLVMSLVSFAWFTTQPYFADMVNIDTRGAILEKSREEELLGSIWFCDGTGDDEDIERVADLLS